MPASEADKTDSKASPDGINPWTTRKIVPPPSIVTRTMKAAIEYLAMKLLRLVPGDGSIGRSRSFGLQVEIMLLYIDEIDSILD